MSKINYKVWKKYSFFIFLFALIATALVFFPGIGLKFGGASRWIDLGFISFQPSEFLKIGFVIYLAAWISGIKNKITSVKYGLLPFVILISLVGAILLKQPDTATFAVIFSAGIAMFILAGARWKQIGVLVLIGLVSLFALVYSRPYLKDRFKTFLDPSANAFTSGYQIQQSLIAIGSGGVFGRGFGQSIQKFSYLPEPMGDSIFAVAAEEFGFIGSLFLIILFLLFAFKGLKISSKISDTFGRLLMVGIVILISSQVFINIGGMLGIIPLTGIPLPFVSHGGTALFITLAEVGIAMNISKHTKRNN